MTAANAQLDALKAEMQAAVGKPQNEPMPAPAVARALGALVVGNFTDRADADFGRTMREMIDAAGGDGAALRDSLIHPTRPGSPERAAQDAAWTILTRRFAKLVKGDEA